MGLISMKEGAKELGISIHTLRAWCYQRRIPFYRLGRRTLVKQEDLQSFVNRHFVQAKGENK